MSSIAWPARALPSGPARTHPQAPDWARSTSNWLHTPVPWPPPRAAGPGSGLAPWFEDSAYQLCLDRVTRAPASSGNWTQLLLDGAASFSHKEAAIRDADAIFLKIYQFDDDHSGQRIAAELAVAAQRGAQVYVQYGLKAFFSLFNMARIKLRQRCPVPPVLQPLLDYPNVRLMPNDFPHRWRDLKLRRDHEKYLITWQRGEPIKLIMGGMNISDAWAEGGNPWARTANGVKYRDTDIEIIGPAAERAVQAFLADVALIAPDSMEDILQTYASMTRTPPNVLYPSCSENAVVRFVRNKPHLKGGQHVQDMYIALLQRVPDGDTVHMENAYVLPNAALSAAMVEAADRGVKIRLVMNAPDSAEFEARLLSLAGRSFCRRLLRRTRQPENFKFYAFHGNREAGYNAMHHKVASFGHCGPFVVGSSNLDAQSLKYNKEDGALVYDQATRQQFDMMWYLDVHNARIGQSGLPLVTTERLTPEVLAADPWHSKLRAWLLMHLAGWVL